jgi:Icc-related predicted phosphoesterase
MKDTILKLSTFEIVGSPYCVASGDGQRVYDRLASALKEGYRVVLSFHNVSIVTSAFLNAAIGQLYGEFTEDKIRESLEVSAMTPDDVALLRCVVETAKQYFADPRIFEQAVRDELEDEDGV